MIGLWTASKLSWNVDAEESPDDPQAKAVEKRLKEQQKKFKQGRIRCNFNSDDDEKQDESESLADLEDIIDLTVEIPVTHEQPESQHAHDPPVIPSNVLLDYYHFGSSKLRPGSTVEIKTIETHKMHKASFLHVQQIIDAPGGIKLRGIPLTRARCLLGRLPRFRNEVAMIIHIDNDDKRPGYAQAAIEVSVGDVIRTRNCHFTNADFPQHRTVLGLYTSIEDLEEKGVLMCRWKCVFKYKDRETRIAHMKQTRKSAAPLEYSIEHINADELAELDKKKRFAVSENGRFNAWRGGKVRGGEHDPGSENSAAPGLIVKLDDKEEPESIYIEKKLGQRYTFGDMFCGAGGTSCGARKAGFQVKVACDHHDGACNTYGEVFPEAHLYRGDIFKFIQSEDMKVRVDVLHLSPPCQVWSPAHTVAGVNDDANSAALFACHELINKLRPRLFTLEQTFGILRPQFEYYFNALIHGFTENHYSVRWKIVDLVNWGCPATRRRLIMIGSCPGEDLPPFPKDTHTNAALDGKKRRRKPHVTVQKMLDRIPRKAYKYDDMHRPHEMVPKELERWDPNVTLTRCITTNGGVGNYHPRGDRDFTLREYATLQTFPVDYPFRNPDRKRQIGNAFPPMAVKVLYTHLRKWLEKKDRVYSVEKEPVDLDDPNIPVCVVEDNSVSGESNSDHEDCVCLGSTKNSNNGTTPDPNDMDLDQSDDYCLNVPCIDFDQRQRPRSTVGSIEEPMDLTLDHD
ncbi:S-adenosyl-L-methionine-dependent methyltransferase [Xylaria arbuscula]|nr:S-adenosyl-L-methionine-dependent methyltransferase [Xylaria arbuscula]